MSFDELIEKAGGFKKLFEMMRQGGVNVEEQIQNAMNMDSELFRKVGYRITNVGEGRAELTFPLNDVITRRGGMVHGGIIMYSLDNVCGLAVMTLNPGVDQVTLELKVNFLEKLKKGPFTAAGKVVRVGGTTAVAEGEVRDADGVTCARSLGTWYIIRKKPRPVVSLDRNESRDGD